MKKIIVIFLLSCFAFEITSYAQTYFSDDFESGLGNWTNAGANPTDFVSSSSYYNVGSNSMRNSSSNNSSTHIVELTSNVDLTTATNVLLQFSHIARTEVNYDFCYVEISEDGGSNYIPIPFASYQGSTIGYNSSERFHSGSYTSAPDWRAMTTFDAPGNTYWVTETTTRLQHESILIIGVSPG